jgi:hypothetical protein
LGTATQESGLVSRNLSAMPKKRSFASVFYGKIRITERTIKICSLYVLNFASYFVGASLFIPKETKTCELLSATKSHATSDEFGSFVTALLKTAVSKRLRFA